MRRLLHFILSHSLFISLCAAALGIQTEILLRLQPDWQIFGLLFCATLSGYNIYWLISKFYFSERKISRAFVGRHKSFILIAAIALCGAIYFLYRLPEMRTILSIGIALIILYSLPLWPFAFTTGFQTAGILKTSLLALTWAYVTTAIPAAAAHYIFSVPWFSLFFARFCFMLLLCIIFDMRDISVDKLHGLHSLATDISKKQLSALTAFIFVCYACAGLFLRLHFNEASQSIAFAVTGLFVWLTYQRSLKPQGYLFYYFITDGLMLLSALLTVVAAIV